MSKNEEVLQNQDRKLHMRFAGGLVKHLGLHMYSGPTAAIAELIANAWDADASRVDITFPFEQDWTSQSEIAVKDNGIGMTFSECEDNFLLVGRDRRKAAGEYTIGGRPVMGHKGIGKLGCFGIAKCIEVCTVKSKWLTRFELDYDGILRHSGQDLVASDPYEPKILSDESIEEQDGTTIILRRIQLEQKVNEGRFRGSMARQFAVLSHEFEVYVNEQILNRHELDFEFRFPQDEMESDTIHGVGAIKWWVGFTSKPVEYEDARGIAVMVRDRLAQKPFFFDLKGGAYGQHGMRYMVGEVYADGLNKGDRDLVSTGRSSILWEDPVAQPLLKWGEEKVKELLRLWAEKRSAKRQDRLKHTTKYIDRISRFPSREREELQRAIDKLATIEDIPDERFEEIVEFLLKAYENENFMNLIRELNALDDSSQEEVFRLFAEWDVLEAIHVAQIVKGRVEIVRKFRQLIESNAREKPDMQDFLKEHPWLIDAGWDILAHEKALDTVLVEYFGREKSGTKAGTTRLDFFCLAGLSTQVVVELKRPGDTVGRKELEQLQAYVDFLKMRSDQSSEPGYKCFVYGRLIASDLEQDAYPLRERMRPDNMYFLTWGDLLNVAEKTQRDYLFLVKQRAPKDDPRIRALADDVKPDDANNQENSTHPSSTSVDSTENKPSADLQLKLGLE